MHCRPSTSPKRLINSPREKTQARELRQTKPLATCITITAVRWAIVAWWYSSADSVFPQSHSLCHKM
jgi:hypothetical protein